MIRRLAAAGLAGLAAALLLPLPAHAHPLGNFTTNQYAGLRVSGTGVDVDYVLDLAELPAFQARQEEVDADRDGTETGAERDGYARRTCAAAAAASTITVGGSARRLVATPGRLSYPTGAGALTTLRLECLLRAAGAVGPGATIGYRQDLYPDRIGWREITAIGDRYTLTSSDVPAASPSARLTTYPAGQATADVRAATLTVRAGGPAAPPAAAGSGEPGLPGGADRLTAWFTDLIGHPELGLGVGVLAVLIAMVLGGAHAAAPGHGKTVMAAYLVGARGGLRPALTIAGAVAVTHTAGVLVLGVVLATSVEIAPVSLYEWLRLAGGLLIAAVGAHLLVRAVRANRARAAHPHPHEPVAQEAVLVGAGAPHPPAHAHDHGNSHDHAHPHGATAVIIG